MLPPGVTAMVSTEGCRAKTGAGGRMTDGPRLALPLALPVLPLFCELPDVVVDVVERLAVVSGASGPAGAATENERETAVAAS